MSVSQFKRCTVSGKRQTDGRAVFEAPKIELFQSGARISTVIEASVWAKITVIGQTRKRGGDLRPRAHAVGEERTQMDKSGSWVGPITRGGGQSERGREINLTILRLRSKNMVADRKRGQSCNLKGASKYWQESAKHHKSD